MASEGNNEINGGNHDLPFAKELWEACKRLRGSVESAEYKHLVLGLIFLKYISDSFERRRGELEAAIANPNSDLHTDDPQERTEIVEDRDEYIAENVFWVPPKARWEPLLAAANQPNIGERLDAALEAVERDNEEQLRGVLPRVYAKAPLEAQKLGELVSTIARAGFGDDADRARDILGRTYEYFINEFARAEGKRGGEFFTPRPVVRLLVEMLEPFEGRVMDPACGSCGMFIQSAEFVERHGGRATKVSIYGQESIQTTWRMGRMNLALHGLSGDIRLGDSLLNDQHAGLKADFVLANPMFNQEEWGAAQVADDGRWKYGTPPNGNANYAWIQHFIHHLAPDGRAGFVMANGSLTTNQSGEGKIREGIIGDDLVDCIVACPGKLFYTTQIPVCLWLLARNKRSDSERDRRGEVLFIDARQMGRKISSTQIEFTADEIERIADTYHAWRGAVGTGYEDVKGFCASVTLDEIEKHDFALTPGRYVGAPESEEDEIEFEERMAGLVDQLADGLQESARLTVEVKRALGAIGYEV